MGVLHAAMDKATTTNKVAVMRLHDSMADGSREVSMGNLFVSVEWMRRKAL